MERVIHIYECHLITDNQDQFPECDRGDKWGVRKKDGNRWVTMGFITESHDFRVTSPVPLPGSFALVALPAFMGKAAYSNVGQPLFAHEVITISIPEVTEQWGLLGAGWPPRAM